MPKPLEFEKPVTPDPNPPPVKDLAQPPPDKTAAGQKPSPKAKTIDTAGAEQFLKAQIGSDRYKQVLAEASKEAPAGKETAPRGEDGKFIKAKEDEKPAEQKPPAKPKQAAFKPSPKVRTDTLTPEQIVAAAAEGAAKAISASRPKETETPAGEKATAGPELPPDEKEKVEILTKMEALFPAKYKGLSDKYKKSLTALDNYAKEWEKNNPGQEFDEESPEHEAFFKENDVDWSDLDFQRAVVRIAVEEANKPLAEKVDEKLAEIERGKELERKQGEIVAQQNSAAQHYWSELGDDVADFINADGSLNMARVKALQESDPEGLSIRVTAAQALDAEVAEIYKLYTGLVKNDWEHNVIHRDVNQFAHQQEQTLAAKPTQEKLNAEGKVFVPAAQWFKMSKAEREHHWTFSAEDIAFLRAKDLAATTNKRIELAEESHKRWAKARGIELENPDAKPESPSAGGESRLAAVNDTTPKTVSPVHSRFFQTQIHGS